MWTNLKTHFTSEYAKIHRDNKLDATTMGFASANKVEELEQLYQKATTNMLNQLMQGLNKKLEAILATQQDMLKQILVLVASQGKKTTTQDDNKAKTMQSRRSANTAVENVTRGVTRNAGSWMRTKKNAHHGGNQERTCDGARGKHQRQQFTHGNQESGKH